MKPKEGTRLWHCMRVRDPVVRKQLIGNLVKQGKTDEKTSAFNIAGHIDWTSSPEGRSYWKKKNEEYRSDPTLLADSPIYDDGLPTGKVTDPKVGEWVVIEGDGSHISGKSTICYDNGTVVQITETKPTSHRYNCTLKNPNIQRTDYRGWGSMLSHMRYATQEEIDSVQKKQSPQEIIKAKYPVGTRVKVVNAGSGAHGVDGRYGIISIETAENGIGIKEPGINILIDKDGGYQEGKVWRVNADAILEIDTRIPLSYKTEDGYTLYTNDKVWWVYKDSSTKLWEWNPHKRDPEPVVEAHKECIEEGIWRLFHSLENAEKWIQQENDKLKPPAKPVSEITWVEEQNRKKESSDSKTYAPWSHKWHIGDWFRTGGTEHQILRVEGDAKVYVSASDGSPVMYTRNEIDKYWEKDWKPIVKKKAPSDITWDEIDEKYKEPEPWSIVTTDGVRVYEGAAVAWLYPDGKKLHHKTSYITSKTAEKHTEAGLLLFSTYEAAEEYRKKQCGEKSVYPEYKIGQRVLIHSGANISEYNGQEGEVVIVYEKYRNGAPWIKVKFKDGSTIQCYKNSKPFNVEILQEPSVVEQCMEPLVERKWKIGDRFQSKEPVVYTIKAIENGRVILEWYSSSAGKIKESDLYAPKDVDKLLIENHWIPYNPQSVPVTDREPRVGDRVQIITDEYSGKYKNTYGTLNSKWSTSSDHWYIVPDIDTTIFISGGTGRGKSSIKEFEVITNNNNQSTNQTKITNNGNKSNSSEEDSNQESYTGISICEWQEEEIISTGIYSKGKSLSVYAEPDNISRGSRITGATLSC